MVCLVINYTPKMQGKKRPRNQYWKPCGSGWIIRVNFLVIGSRRVLMSIIQLFRQLSIPLIPSQHHYIRSLYHNITISLHHHIITCQMSHHSSTNPIHCRNCTFFDLATLKLFSSSIKTYPPSPRIYFCR